MEIDLNKLPEDIEQCRAMIAELVTELDAKAPEVKQLQHVVEELLRWRYGQRAERVDENQLVLFAAGILGTHQDIQTLLPEVPQPKPQATPHGRQRLPEHLPRQR